LCCYEGIPVFRGLVTGCNEIGEVRINRHVVSDAQDQLKVILQEFKETAELYGQTPLKHVITDKPNAEKKMYLELFPSLQE